MPRRTQLSWLVVLACLLACGSGLAAQDTLARRLPAVAVTRDAERSPMELPYAITALRPDSLAPGQTHTLVDQTLALIPGLTVANRNNPSQDARISIRGFGARSAFGVRSLRVLRDGMPLTLPDGQTPIDYLDLESVGQVETIRGTASALYGNASGGIIDLRTAPPPAAPFGAQLRAWGGAHAFRRFVGLLGGSLGDTSATFQGSIGHTQTDGDRAYSRQRLTNAFVRATGALRGTELALIGMGLDMPLAENPGALTRAQFDTNPRMADPASIAKRARKTVHQVQLGLSARHQLFGDGDVLAQVYGSGRTLGNPLTFAVVGIDRRSGGASLRATAPVRGGRVDQRLTIGVDVQRLNDARKNWSNCNAVPTATANCPVVGVERGALQLDQRELVTSVGPYIRDELAFDRVRATLGVRSDNTTFELRDAFLSDGRDDSGRRRMSAVSPMLGVAVRVTPFHTVYTSLSSAFETPTTTELGNQADGSAGLNPDLRPQYSTSLELGVRGFAGPHLQYDVATYSTSVRDELIPFLDAGGRTYYRNAGRTRRRGAEVALDAELGRLTLRTAYTYSRFRFRDFMSGTTQVAGNTIPGIPAHQLQTTATVRFGTSYAVAEWMAKDGAFVNDANSATAPGFAVLNLRVMSRAVFGRPWIAPIVGVQNVFDRKYVGSIAVNAAGTLATAKFYEPGAGRSWVVGLNAAAW